MSVLASDDFNRADAETLGANWTAAYTAHPPGIFNNGVDGTTTGNNNGAHYSAISWPNDQYSQATCFGAGNTFWAVGVRMPVGAANTKDGYFGGKNNADFGATGLRIWKVVSEVPTTLIDNAVALANSDVVNITVVGTQITLYVNNVQQLTVSDSSLASGDAGFMLNNDPIDVIYLDNWSGGDFGAPTTFLLGQGCM